MKMKLSGGAGFLKLPPSHIPRWWIRISSGNRLKEYVQNYSVYCKIAAFYCLGAMRPGY
jgi:hypothetical protein